MKINNKLKVLMIGIIIPILSGTIYIGAIKPKLYDKYINLGSTYLMSEEYEKAIEAFKQALEKKDKSTTVRIKLAQAYVENNEIDKAIEILKEAQEVDIKNKSLLKEILLILNQVDSDTSYDFLRKYISAVGKNNIPQDIKEILDTANEIPSKPSVSIESGKYTEGISLKLELDKIKIGHNYYYTLDGSEPNRNSQKYTGNIEIDKTTTVKLIGYNNQDENTDVIELKYIINKEIIKDIEKIIKQSEKLLNNTDVGTEEGNTTKESKEKLESIIDKVKEEDLFKYENAKKNKEQLEKSIKEFKNSLVEPTDKSKLKSAISSAQSLYENSKEGSGEGKYKSGAKDTLLKAINKAKSINDNKSVTQSSIDSATKTLNSAISTFKNSKNNTSKSNGSESNGGSIKSPTSSNFTEEKALQYAQEYGGYEFEDFEYYDLFDQYMDNEYEDESELFEQYSDLEGEICLRRYTIQSSKFKRNNKFCYKVWMEEQFYASWKSYIEELYVYEDGTVEFINSEIGFG